MSKNYRYPGSKPFSQEDTSVYFGRSKDIDNLYKYVNVENLVVLYGKSGLGKSSLINAGLLERLHEKEFLPMPIRFNNYLQGSNTNPLQIAVQKIVGEEKTDCFLNRIEDEQITLWQYLKSIELKAEKNLKFVLIFDQFEELFTFPEGVADFAQQLTDLIDKRVPKSFQEKMNRLLDDNEDLLDDSQIKAIMQGLNVKIVLSIRSDKLNLLNHLKSFIPTILLNCYELLPLSSEQAQEAILKPAMQTGDFITPKFAFSPEAINRIIVFLTQNGQQHVEAFQLQMLCQYIEQHVIREKNKNIVEPSDVKDLAYLVENYYEYQIGQICQNEHEKNIVTHLIEDGLIFEQEEQRLSLFVGQIKTEYKISDELLIRLVNSRLIRAEIGSTGGIYYELSHDTLVEPILKAKNKRKEEELKKQQEYEKQEEIRKISSEKEQKNRRRFWRAVSILGAAFCGVVAAFSLVIYFKNQDLEKNFKELSKQSKLNQQLTDSIKNTAKILDSLNGELQNMYNSDIGKLQREINEMEKQLQEVREEKTLTVSDEQVQRNKIRKMESDLLDLRAKYQLKEREFEQRQDDFKRLNREFEKALYKNVRNQKEYEALRDGILQKYIQLERKF